MGFCINFNFLILLVFLSKSILAAPPHPCFPDGNVNVIQPDYFDIDAPSDGSSPAGPVAEWDTHSPAKIYCTGGDPKSSPSLDVQFQFIFNDAYRTLNQNGRDYIIINEYFGVAFETRVGNNIVPISVDSPWVSNQQHVQKPFDDNGVYRSSTIGSGGVGKVYLLILKPFIGEQVIPSSHIFSIRAALGGQNDAATFFSKLNVQGTVKSDAACNFTDGVYFVDFGNFTGNAISTAAGFDNSTIKKSLNININCTGGGADALVDISMVGKVSIDDERILETDNPKIGIGIKSNKNWVYPMINLGVMPDERNRIITESDGNIKRATIEVAPIKIAVDKVEPGLFNASATLKIDFR
ncbi:fimbrial protein [Aeromonas salmonicida]|uniref:fimbrial protein n=1 Tax=Aeromonas salmonicida TaxID=645 RepID=UPI00259F0569|nr:fimbrial protein [Aeromonas salmonicida]MDM5065436.1 fimbrial protein [Aeromonas salmonicida]